MLPSVEDAAALLRERRISSVELTTACLARADALAELGAFITWTPEDALRAAHDADDLLGRGVDRGPFHGVPVALKDLFDVIGVRTTAGSAILADNVAVADSAVTERLRGVAAVLVGKTSLHEWAFGVTNQNPRFGAAKNPYDRSRIPGGSSGGSAIAVATGICAMALGTDTGGSIRIPAALCGVVGLKPTYGRVSLRGVVPLAWTLDHAGPLTRTVRDAALALALIAGYDEADPVSIDASFDDPLAGIEDGVRGMRVLVPTTHFFTAIDPEVEAAVREAARVLGSLGATLVEGPLPHTELLRETQRRIIGVEAAAYHREDLARYAARDDAERFFGRDVLERLRAGERIAAVEHAEARRQRDVIRRQWSTLLREYEVVLTPTTPNAAPLREGEDALEAAMRLTTNTSPFNLTGLPAISVPCGATTSGLPIGLQLAAGPWREATLLRAARAFERATEWHERRPAG